MIPPQTAALVTSIASGFVRLTGRVDRVLAERVAVTSDLAVPLPDVISGIGAVTMRNDLDRLVNDEPERLGADLEAIRKLLDNPDTVRKKLTPYYRKWFPEAVVDKVIDPNREFAKELKKRAPYLDLDDVDVKRAVYFVSAGEEARENSYSWRLALTVVDALAEFGAENASLITKDERTRKVLQAVLTRFSSPDLSTMGSWSVLLKHVLSATLNGVVDARDVWDGDDLWVDVILTSLEKARNAAPDPDNYLMGLVQGSGYRRLIAALLEEGGTRLAKESGPAAKKVIGAFLAKTAPIVSGSSAGFEDFFREHWADLVRSGLSAAAVHGEELLAGTSPPVQQTLIAMVSHLSTTEGTEFLKKENLIGVADAALATVAAKPDIFFGTVGDERLKAILSSVAAVAAKQGLEPTVTREGLEKIGRGVLKTFAERPELLVKRPGLYQEMVGTVLDRVAGLDKLSATTIATAAVAGGLEAVSASPELLEGTFTGYLAHVAGRVGKLVGEKGVDRVQAEDLITAAVDGFLENPELMARIENGLFDAVLDGLARATDSDDAKLLAGATFTATAAEVLSAFARHGAPRADDPVEELVAGLAKVVSAAAARASVEVGHRIGLSDVPEAIGKLTGAWLSGRLGVTDPDDPGFKRAFTEVVESLAA